MNDETLKPIKCIHCHKRILDAEDDHSVHLKLFIKPNPGTIVMKCPHCKTRLQIEISK